MGLAGGIEDAGSPTPNESSHDHADTEEQEEHAHVPYLGEAGDAPAVVVDDEKVVVRTRNLHLPTVCEEGKGTEGEDGEAEKDDDHQGRNVAEQLHIEGGKLRHQPVL